LDIHTNTSAGSGGTNGIGLRKQGTSTSTDIFGLKGLGSSNGSCTRPGSPAGTPNVENFINCLNPARHGTLLISATSGFTDCSTSPASIRPLPTSAILKSSDGGVSQEGSQAVSTFSVSAPPTLAADRQRLGIESGPRLSQAELLSIAQAA